MTQLGMGQRSASARARPACRGSPACHRPWRLPALAQVVHCRRILKWTYATAYYRSLALALAVGGALVPLVPGWLGEMSERRCRHCAVGRRLDRAASFAPPAH